MCRKRAKNGSKKDVVVLLGPETSLLKVEEGSLDVVTTPSGDGKNGKK